MFSQITVKNYEEPKIKAIEIAALLQEKYAFLTGESKSPNFLFLSSDTQDFWLGVVPSVPHTSSYM